MMDSTDLDEILAPCRKIAREAGDLIMTYFSGRFETRKKQDKSPVTDADLAANHHITGALRALTPHIPVIAEEDEDLSGKIPASFWLVDPLDGTRSFVRGEAEFTVNIGLVENGKPVLGVIYAPPQQLLYFAEKGRGAFRQQAGGKETRLSTRAPNADGLVVVRSKSHPSKETAAYLETLRIKEIISGSSAIKFCQVAEGAADLYPRFGRTMEWDTAAGHAILNEAGGRIETTDGKPLLYGKPRFENPAFIAYGR